MSACTPFPRALASQLPEDARAAAAARLAPFVEAGVLGPLAVQVVGRLAERAGTAAPDLLLGLAFAVRAPQHGHVCVDLATLTPEQVLPEDPEGRRAAEAAAVRAAWPADGPAWRDAVAAATALVRPAPAPEAPPDAPTTPFVLEGGQLYMDRWWRYQRVLAEALRARAAAPVPRDQGAQAAGLDLLFRPPAGAGEAPGLNRQRLAGAVALLRPLLVLSGGPGMGKTWTVRNVLALLWLRRRAQAEGRPLRVALAAPTGKAAARMRESLRAGLDPGFLARVDALGGPGAGAAFKAFVLGQQARTLHRLLGFQPGSPTRFRHDARSPLAADVVVVDEASMVDLAMMAKLVQAVRPDARLVLLGDRNQLASVEAGTVLSDLCGPTRVETLALPPPVQEACAGELALPGFDPARVAPGSALQGSVVQLDRTYRFKDDSGIGAFARACLADDASPADTAALLASSDWPDLERRSWPPGGGLGAGLEALVRAGYAPALDLLRDGYDPAVHGCVEAFHRAVLEAYDRFRLLCAHRRGRAGVSGVNLEVARVLAEREERVTQGPRAWLGRPVLVTENAYAVGRFNGDVGMGVTRCGAVDGPELVVAFPGPDSPPAGAPPAEVAAAVAAGELRLVEYLEPARLPAWQPVYAMTIHKSQGSEFEHAVVLLPERPSPILTRELVYTAVTRAKARVTLVGGEAVLERALATPVKRASGLGALLWGPGEGPP